jgi:2-C-methyl-D-erythritol 4-phosphate cytidylyltransferase
MNRHYYAIILAGGQGLRMGHDIPKQFIEIEGKPILRHTIERFMESFDEIEIIVVLPSGEKEYWKEYCNRTGFLQRYIMPSGGITRFHSVQNALKYVPGGAIVAIHDGVRPFVTSDFLRSMFEKMGACKALVPVIPPVESLREIGPDGISTAVDRSRYRLVQTPQIFHSELVKEAYSQPYNPLFTDDASVVEYLGHRVSLCEGLSSNIKITTPEDLAVAKAIFREEKR